MSLELLIIGPLYHFTGGKKGQGGKAIQIQNQSHLSLNLRKPCSICEGISISHQLRMDSCTNEDVKLRLKD